MYACARVKPLICYLYQPLSCATACGQMQISALNSAAHLHKRDHDCLHMLHPTGQIEHSVGDLLPGS